MSTNLDGGSSGRRQGATRHEVRTVGRSAEGASSDGAGQVQEEGLQEKRLVGIPVQLPGSRRNPSGGVQSLGPALRGGPVQVAAAERRQPEPQLVVT